MYVYIYIYIISIMLSYQFFRFYLWPKLFRFLRVFFGDQLSEVKFGTSLAAIC